MLPYLTARQYEEWVAWMRETHPYPNRDDIHWAMLLAMTHNQWSDTPLRPADISPYIDPYEAELTPQELARRCGLL